MADIKPIVTRVVSCPHCRASVRYDVTNPFRPFCSARCKGEDIIGWADEKFRIAGKPDPDGEGDGVPTPSTEPLGEEE
jgi:uncharacterized protein